MSELIIAHHNIRSATNKLTELKLYIQKHKPHIMTLNEIFNNTNIYITGYTLTRPPHKKTGKGVGILYKNELDVTELPPIDTKQPTTNLHHAILLKTKDNRHVQITTIYCPRKQPSKEIIDETCKRQKHNIITGDFNCKHEDFGHDKADKDGNQLVQYMTENNMTKLNDNEPTYTNDATGKQDVKDLIFSSPKFTKTFQDLHVDEDIGSDHNIIRAIFSQQPYTLQRDQTIALYHQADWTDINHTITTEMSKTPLTHTSSTEDIDKYITKLTSTIQSTLKDKVKRIQIKLNSTPLPQHIRELIQQKKQNRTAWKRTHNKHYKTEYNRLNTQIQILIKQERQDKWDKKCDDLELQDNQHTTWRQLKQTLGLRAPATKYPTLKKTNEDGITTKATTTKEKTALLTEALQNIFTHDHPPDHFNEQYKQNVQEILTHEHDILQPLTTVPPDFLQNDKTISIETINKTIDKLNNKKAPGPDKITNKVIKLIKPSLSPILFTLINICKQKGYHPHTWKTALAILLNKPDKPPTNPNNYRPISLINSLSKILELLITQELRTWTEDNNILPDTQAGFRQNKSTQDKLYITTQMISQAKNRRHYASSIFLDVEKAFDKVWLQGLIYKLYILNYPTHLIRYISSYLTDRYIYFNIKNNTSEHIKLNTGVPQGSSLSPLLYIIFTSDIPTPPSRLRIIRTQFADDLQDITTGRDIDSIQTRHQKALNALAQYNNNYRTKINASKSAQLIYNFRKLTPSHYKLTLNNTTIPQKDTAKFLGITFDKSLTFNKHITIIRNRAQQRLNKLRNIYTSTHGPSPTTMIRLYKIYVRPLFEYGSAALVIADLEKWETAQNSYIKHILQLNHISNNRARQYTQLPTIKDRVTQLARQWHTKTTLSNTQTTKFEQQHIKEYITGDKYWTPHKLITFNKQQYIETLKHMNKRKKRNKAKKWKTTHKPQHTK